MKVILVLQIIKIVGLTGQPLFCTTRVLQVNRTVRTTFIVYAMSSYSFLFNFVNSTILGYYLGLLTAIIPKRSWIKEIRPIKTHLGPIAYSGDLNFQRHSSINNSWLKSAFDHYI